jgi:hypothetical protein
VDRDNQAEATEPTGTATKTYEPGPARTLRLEPKSAVNPVDSRHCVTATVEDAFGNPVPRVTVRFTVTGSVTTSGSRTTDRAHSLNVLAVTCSEDRKQATVFGQARIDGEGSHFYRIGVTRPDSIGGGGARAPLPA